MPWFFVDDGFADCPKLAEFPDDATMLAAVGLWTLSGSWSRKKLTGGFVPHGQVRRFGATPELATALVASGLWEDANGGYRFHDWSEWQETPDEVDAKRATNRQRQRAWREKRAKNRVVSSLSQRDNTVSHDVTDALVTRESQPHNAHVTGIPLPLPHPESKSLTTFGTKAPDGVPESADSAAVVTSGRETNEELFHGLSGATDVASQPQPAFEPPAGAETLSLLPHEPPPAPKPAKPRDEAKALWTATLRAEAKALGIPTPEIGAKVRDAVLRMAREHAANTGESFASVLRAWVVGGLKVHVETGKPPQWALKDWRPYQARGGPSGGRPGRLAPAPPAPPSAFEDDEDIEVTMQRWNNGN